MDKDNFGNSFKIIFNSILNDIIDIDNQLFQFLKALMNIVKIAFNIHWSPC